MVTKKKLLKKEDLMGGIANRRCYFNVLFYGNLLNSNLTKWSNTLRQDNSLAVANELFEYVWPFCEVGA